MKKHDSNSEKREYIRRLERKLDELIAIQELTEKEIKKAQKSEGSPPEWVSPEKLVGLFLLIAGAGSFAYALVADPSITGSAVGAGNASPSIILSLAVLLLVIFLVIPRQHND